MKRVFCLAVLMLAVAAVAHADSLTLAPGLTANATLTTSGNTFNLVMTFSNTTGSNATINGWVLQTFNPGSITGGSFVSLPTGWNFADNDKISNSGSGTCNQPNSINGWLCTSDQGIDANAATIAAGGSLVFEFNGTFTGSVATPLDLMANGCTVAGTCDSNNDNKWAVSTAMTSTQVPEPASTVLLGSGLSALGILGRRKFRR